MQEHRIVTHLTELPGEPNPWSAFIFQPDSPDQTPDDYIASNCGMLDTFDLIAFGKTEAEAVFNLFKKQEPVKKADKDVKEIFHKNSSFGPGYQPRQGGYPGTPPGDE